MADVAQILVPKGIVVPAFEPLPTHQLRLRWGFDFADGRFKHGPWDSSSPHEADMATRVNKAGLIRAYIEGESRLTGEESIIVECQGQDFAFFQWEAYRSMRGLNAVCGLHLFTRHERITVSVNGRASRRPLTADEAKFKYQEHSI